MYTVNENNQHNLQTYISKAAKAEQFLSDFFTQRGFTVANLTSEKLIDLHCTNKNTGAVTTVEVKQNYRSGSEHLWLENINSIFLGMTSGWMYTSTADKIVFLDHDLTEIIIADTVNLRQAFLQVIALFDHEYGVHVYNASSQDNINNGKEYRSYCYHLPIAELENHGAKFKRFRF